MSHQAIATKSQWLNAFPELSLMPADILSSLAALPTVQAPAGAVLFREGDRCRGYVFVIQGSIRVQKLAPDGHEIVLYRVEDGQTCMLTTSCLLGDKPYPAEGVAEEDSLLTMIPAAAFETMLANPLFRRFVLGKISDRIAELMRLIEDVAFGRLDTRLARRLLELDDGSHELCLTHQQLASELGTAREVVSRILKTLEHRGMLSLKRGKVIIRDAGGLRKLAAERP